MRSILTLLLALFLTVPALAQGNDTAEQFVATNIRTGLSILADTGLDANTRAARFESFLLENTDLPRIAVFTLGTAPASPAQRDAFVAAFREYALASYRSYFSSYSGQTLRVTGSRQNAPGDVIVRTQLADGSGSLALPVDFRIRTDGLRPVVIDVGISGIWLAVTQRDDFAAFLARNNGDVAGLTAYLSAKASGAR